MKTEYRSFLQETKEKYEGNVFKSNRYGDFIVLEANAANDITIEFKNTGYKATVFLTQVNNGSITDHSAKLILGVGIVGSKLSKEERKGKVYRNWCQILKRCYSEKIKYKFPTYDGCTMSDNFKYYPYFKEWYMSQKNWDDPDFVLDKDLLSEKHTKIYSEDTCVFLPKEINSLLTTTKASRGDLPIGVCKLRGNRASFRACIGKNSKNFVLGYYQTPEEAFYAYKIAREDYLKEKANQWKDMLDERAYNALYNYQVEITD